MNLRIDVTEVILDPDFADYSLTYTRNAESISTHGRAVLTPTTLGFAGVVTSDSGDILERTADSSRVKGTIVIHTLVRLRMNGTDIDADLVDWNGSTYTVTSVNDYSTYGAGFVAATCAIRPLTG